MAELTKEHKEAMQRGREQARIVREYLDAIHWSAARPGLPSDPEAVESAIEDYRERIAQTDDYVDRLELVQKRVDLEDYLDELRSKPDVEAAEKAFIGVAQEYSERKGVDYRAWRELDVPASVLREAGVPR